MITLASLHDEILSNKGNKYLGNFSVDFEDELLDLFESEGYEVQEVDAYIPLDRQDAVMDLLQDEPTACKYLSHFISAYAEDMFHDDFEGFIELVYGHSKAVVSLNGYLYAII